MKLASYKDGSRDGQLVVVSRDLRSAHYASGIATRLQQVLDDWNFMSPQLQHVYDTLNQGKLRHAFPFDPAQCMAPLPRPAQWIVALSPTVEDASAVQPGLWRGASDHLLGPRDDIVLAAGAVDIAVDGLVAAITGDVPRGASTDTALDGVRLLMLAIDITLSQVERSERERGLPAFQSKPATAFSAVAITPDELGQAWKGGHVNLTMQTRLNDRQFHFQDSTESVHIGFAEVISKAAVQRDVRAGSIFACRLQPEVSQKADAFAMFGDTVGVRVQAADGSSPFADMNHRIVAASALL